MASLHLRGISPIEIVTALNHHGVTADLETVCEDIQFLQDIWATEVQVKTEHKARVLAELREARRAAWANGDIELVLKCLRQETDLLNLDKLLDLG